MKKQSFLHNFKNIFYVGAKLNVKKKIYVGENPDTRKERQCGLGHLLWSQTSLKHTEEMLLCFLAFHQG